MIARSQAVPAERTIDRSLSSSESAAEASGPPPENFTPEHGFVVPIRLATTRAPAPAGTRPPVSEPDASRLKNGNGSSTHRDNSASISNPRTPLAFLTPPFTRPPVAMLGIPFDHVTAADSLSWIQTAIASRRPHYVVTANVDFLVQARFDVELRRILFDAHLVLCDGTPLVWASKLLGNALPERVAGADVVPALIQVAAEKGYRLFFLGAT